MHRLAYIVASDAGGHDAEKALRKLGPYASAAKLRAYINGLHGWTGVNGPHDFKAQPQRGWVMRISW